MTIYYSASLGGFAAEGFGSIPEDAIEISSEQHQLLLHALNVEHKVIAIVAGVPTAIDPPPPPLETVKAARIAALSVACRNQILAGFTSSALGEPHAYPSGETDQRNMIASVTASLLPGLPEEWTTPFWCADSAGEWSMRAHSAGQIQQAGADGKAAIVAAQLHLASLAAAVAGATSADAVEAIAW